ncbi:alpha/beta hydrolase [Nocardioides conyzicola]|uniref:Alpha/beta fold hydrolase n=1 Tax=Nocardioides conyzicola TaxID=1651781 RepID=A0ABP8X6W3_9ACTN
MTTFLLVPGAGGDARFWDRLVAELEARGHRGIPVQLPAADESAGLAAYADEIVAVARDAGPLVLVAQSLGGFSAPLAVDRLDVERLVLLNAMVPAPGETAGEWWSNVGQGQAARAAARRDGRPEEFDMVEDFFHDVPPDVTEEILAGGGSDESERSFTEPWPLDRWPDVPTSGIAGADDRLFPPDLQQRVARERLGIDLTVVPGGHLVALANPGLVAGVLVGD